MSDLPAEKGPNPPAAPQFDERGLPAGYPFRPHWEVTPRQVKAMLQGKEDFLLVDCRTPGEHNIAHIEGAMLLPLQQLVARTAELAAHQNRKIVVHCHHGGRSLQMASILRQIGFSDVTSMAGGIDVWAMDIEPGMKRY